MDKQAQYTMAGLIYGLIALLALGFDLLCVYEVFHSTSPAAPAVVPCIALLGLVGCGATFATLYAFSQAMKGAQS